MMKEIKLDHWEEFERKLAELRSPGSFCYARGPLQPSKFLFRGHSDAEWHLTTTLERRLRDYANLGDHSTLLADYIHHTNDIRPQIESFTGRSWNVPPPEKINEWLSEGTAMKLFDVPGYDFLIHLRHHGFPSPLLDWTASPYVAAFFAFSRATEGRVAIYAFLEDIGWGKVGRSDKPRIITLGPYVKTHTRHFLQQSEYSLCLRRNDDGGHNWKIALHEDVFDRPERQDLLWKLTLPANERTMVLKRLNDFNLNAYSLFHSEESLLETLATREIDFRWSRAQ